MKSFIREHEVAVEEACTRGAVSVELCDYHHRQVQYLQAERLAHLLVLLCFGILVLVAGVGVAFSGSWLFAAVFFLLAALLIAYVGHYYRLENAVQRWYGLGRRLERAARRELW